MGFQYRIFIATFVGIPYLILATQWTSITRQVNYDNYTEILAVPAPETKFLLVNPDNVTERTEIYDDFSAIDPSLETIVLTHGWNTYINTSWYYDVPSEFYKRGQYNIILVNWDEISNEFYTSAAPKTKIVGAHLGDFLLRAAAARNISFSRVHLVGHSLGAHVSGFAGKMLKQNGNLLTRITALDPANPGFATFGMNNEDHRLSKADAVTVVVLHTDAGALGISDPIGSVDFYPNCGTAVQLACFIYRILEILDTSQLFCSHSMAFRYFTESINSKNFVGENCTDNSCKSKKCNQAQTAIFGPDTPAETRGIFFYRTNSSEPYGLGISGLKL